MPSKLSQPWRVPRNISTWDDARLIYEAMRKHSENEKVALGGCRALRRCGLTTADAIATVVSAMRAHSSEKLQRTAVAALAEATPQRAHTVSNAGGLQAIMKAMAAHADDGELQSHGCAALAALAADERCEAEVADAGGLGAVVKALAAHADDVNLQRSGCEALASIAAGAHRLAVVDAGGLAAAVNAMAAHVTDAEVQRAGCAVLTSLARAAGCEEAVVAAGGPLAVVAAMTTHAADVGVACEGCFALANLAVRNLTCERVVLAAGGARAITASIDKHAGDARVVEAAGAALRRMTYVAW